MRGAGRNFARSASPRRKIGRVSPQPVKRLVLIFSNPPLSIDRVVKKKIYRKEMPSKHDPLSASPLTSDLLAHTRAALSFEFGVTFRVLATTLHLSLLTHYHPPTLHTCLLFIFEVQTSLALSISPVPRFRKFSRFSSRAHKEYFFFRRGISVHYSRINIGVLRSLSLSFLSFSRDFSN